MLSCCGSRSLAELPSGSTPLLADNDLLAALPSSLSLAILSLLPADQRAVAACVSRAWLQLASDIQVWRRLSLTGLRVRCTTVVLRAAAAKAHGTLTALDCAELTVGVHTLLEVATVNASTLRELSVKALYQVGFVSRDAVCQLLTAAPLLEKLEVGFVGGR